MRLLHLSDLHLGKRLYECPLLPDQEDMLQKVLAVADAEKPDVLIVAGDVYDRNVPPEEAVRLLDRFLVAVSARGLPCLLISGNHDSPGRLSFGSRLLARSGVYVAPAYDGTCRALTLMDASGPVDFYLLPFVKPVHVRACFPEEKIDTYTEAVACAVRHMNVDPSRRSVLVAHQFVTGGVRSDSEEVVVGGLDNVDASAFGTFAYVALGHLHAAQNTAGPRVRYSGAPLAYSFSEAEREKSVTVADIGPAGELTVRAVPLKPLRALLTVRGSYMEVMSRSFARNFDPDSYLRVVLTDEEPVPGAAAQLRVLYPHLLALVYDNARTRGAAGPDAPDSGARLSPEELFAALYSRQNGRPLSPGQAAYMKDMLRQVWEEKA